MCAAVPTAEVILEVLDRPDHVADGRVPVWVAPTVSCHPCRDDLTNPCAEGGLLGGGFRRPAALVGSGGLKGILDTAAVT